MNRDDHTGEYGYDKTILPFIPTRSSFFRGRMTARSSAPFPLVFNVHYNRRYRTIPTSLCLPSQKLIAQMNQIIHLVLAQPSLARRHHGVHHHPFPRLEIDQL